MVGGSVKPSSLRKPGTELLLTPCAACSCDTACPWTLPVMSAAAAPQEAAPRPVPHPGPQIASRGSWAGGREPGQRFWETQTWPASSGREDQKCFLFSSGFSAGSLRVSFGVMSLCSRSSSGSGRVSLGLWGGGSDSVTLRRGAARVGTPGQPCLDPRTPGQPGQRGCGPAERVGALPGVPAVPWVPFLPGDGVCLA